MLTCSQMLPVLLTCIFCTNAFGYRDNEEVRTQMETCMIPVESCKSEIIAENFSNNTDLVKCSSETLDHDKHLAHGLEQAPSDFGTVHDTVHQIRFSTKCHFKFQNSISSGVQMIQFCLNCFKNMVIWEERCLSKLFNAEYFWA